MEPKSSNTVRDIFLHLLSIIALYLVSFAFGRLLFSAINIYFPDLLAYNGDEYEALRFAIASIIVVFPVYFFVTRFLARERAKPAYSEVRLRRWLIYLTLFLASIVIITDVVALLHTLLGGELTVRFILKVCAVLLIAAAVFYYYLWELLAPLEAGPVRGREGSQRTSASNGAGRPKAAVAVPMAGRLLTGRARVPAIRAFVIGTIVVVLAAVVLGFFLIGSPTQRRAVRFDERRVADLQSLQYEIVNYWQQKEQLPVTLDDLKDPIRGFIVPRDPETDALYAYRPTSSLAFELCATFTTEAQASSPQGMAPRRASPYPYAEKLYSENWQHGAGVTCFARTIDPELYPPLNKQKR